MRAWKWRVDLSESASGFRVRCPCGKTFGQESPRRRILTRGHAAQDGHTPLFFAVMLGHVEVVQVLLEAGANKEATSKVRMRRVGEGDRVRIGVASRVSWGSFAKGTFRGQALEKRAWSQHTPATIQPRGSGEGGV